MLTFILNLILFFFAGLGFYLNIMRSICCIVFAWIAYYAIPGNLGLFICAMILIFSSTVLKMLKAREAGYRQ
jgi:hypothetical protein